MKKKTIVGIFFTLFLLITIAPNNVHAYSNYENIDTRINQNKTMINSSNSLNSTDRKRYMDKRLTDLKETNYKGLTSYQQSKIEELANTILEGNNNITNESKITKFHDWIVDNYYYYEYPNRLSTLKNFGNIYDNPYYLLTYEYKDTGKIRARSNGYASMLVALARTQGIPARTVGGFYNENIDINYQIWSKYINQTFVEVFINNNWIVIDPSADCYKEYIEDTNEYKIVDEGLQETNKHKYLNPSIETLSETHIMFNHYPGLKSIAYITNSNEINKITTFLNRTYNKKSNGKRINSSYNKNNPSTWFHSRTESIGDGYGRSVLLHWPENKGLAGTLDLSYFQELRQVEIAKNKITNLKIVNSPKLKSLYVTNNSLNRIIVTGSSNLSLLSAKGNPVTYAEYNFGPARKKAIIKTTSGGTVSLRYENKSKNRYVHDLRAITKSGYKFAGWYQGKKRISKKTHLVINKTTSFSYTAKFTKRANKTYIVVSIKRQKLWYYKNGKLKLTSNVVTGHKKKYDTPKKTYKILGKARSVYLVGKDYKSFVNYWILIDRRNQIGLHDATWRSSFGGPIYKYNGSHGCVNMPYKNARYVYNYIPIGTKIYIK